jgi:hypothetical protein
MESEERDWNRDEGICFYGDAQRYDLISEALSGAGPVEFYRGVARQYGGPVLELACGSGRLPFQSLETVWMLPASKLLPTSQDKRQICAKGARLVGQESDSCVVRAISTGSRVLEIEKIRRAV